MRSISPLIALAILAAGCANPGGPEPHDGGVPDLAKSRDLSMGGGSDLAGADMAMAVGDGGGNCIQVANWPGLQPAGGYDAMNMVTFVASSDVMNPPFNALTIEDWHMSATYPKSVTYSAADKYSTCDVCTVIQVCDMNGCNYSFFAQAGTVNVMQADQNDQKGTMKASVQNLMLVEWDFSMTGDKPVPGGKCYQIGSATFNVSWMNAPPDGGAPDGPPPMPDLVQGKDGAPPMPDLAGADLALGCTPKVNELEATGTKASDEFVEIFNPCPGDIDLTGWKLEYRSAANNSGGGANTIFSFTQKITAGGYLVLGGSGFGGMKDGTISGGLAGAGGAVALVAPSGTVVDSVAYQVLTAPNAFTEGMPAPNPPAMQSIERLPNGVDTNNNASDFKLATPTPGAVNK
jgi:hypothetical protein